MESNLDTLLNSVDCINNCAIYCCYKTNNGKQFKIIFRDNHSYKDSIETIYYRDYLKDSSQYQDISLFGNKIDILKKLLFNVMDKRHLGSPYSSSFYSCRIGCCFPERGRFCLPSPQSTYGART